MTTALHTGVVQLASHDALSIGATVASLLFSDTVDVAVDAIDISWCLDPKGHVVFDLDFVIVGDDEL